MLKKTMGMKLLVSLLIWEQKDPRDVENYQDRIYRQFVLGITTASTLHSRGERYLNKPKRGAPLWYNQKLKKSQQKAP